MIIDDSFLVCGESAKAIFYVNREAIILKKDKETGEISKVKKSINKGGYEVVYVGMVEYVHRLVATLFIENPENKPEVDHIDTNKLNNKASNLRWVTRVENMNNEITKRNKPINRAMLGVKFSEEHKRKISESNLKTKKIRRDEIMVESRCEVCGKLISSIPSMMKKTCSKECAKVLRSRLWSGENNPMYGTTISDRCREIISNKVSVTFIDGTKKLYNSQSEAAHDLGVGLSTMSRAVRGEFSKKLKNTILRVESV